MFNLTKRGKLQKFKRPIGQGLGGTRIVFDAAQVVELGALTPAAVEIGEAERTRKKGKRTK